MKILFLHGLNSSPGGVKPKFLASHGHEVINPALDNDDFEVAVATAQAEFDKHKPDVIVGSSRGGAVAMNMNSADVPLVLMCPAWKRYGTANTVKENSCILHSMGDEVIPFHDSELLRKSYVNIIETGNDHRLSDSESLTLMLMACQELGHAL